MQSEKKRIYVDTSVVLGKFDENESRRRDTEQFWHAVQSNEVVALISDVLREELADSSEQVRKFIAELPESQFERVVSTDESNTLAKRYVAERVVTGRSMKDCKHVAIATVNHADGIVSWNLHDMVKRKKKYNSVNTMLGYPIIKILTPNRIKEILR
jgi:predicted nucleic acid-binding protein